MYAYVPILKTLPCDFSHLHLHAGFLFPQTNGSHMLNICNAEVHCIEQMLQKVVTLLVAWIMSEQMVSVIRFRESD